MPGQEYVDITLPDRHSVKAVIFKGLGPSDIEAMQVRVNGVVCVEITSGYDEDMQPITAGEFLSMMNGVKGLGLCGGQVSLLFEDVGGGGGMLRTMHHAVIRMRLRRGIEARVIEWFLAVPW